MQVLQKVWCPNSNQEWECSNKMSFQTLLKELHIDEVESW